MKSFLKFIFIFSSILLLSAILAPFLYNSFPSICGEFGSLPVLSYLCDHVDKFERIFNRLVMIFSLVAIVFFVRIKKETFIKYQLIWKSTSGSYLTRAFLTSVMILTFVAIVEMVAGQAKWSPQAIPMISLMGKMSFCLGAAFLIGVIEEFFFRGFIFQTMKGQFKWGMGASIIVTNIFYALLHFVHHEKPFIGAEPTFVDSVRLMGAPFMSLLDWQAIWPAAVGLFIFGVVLNLLVLRTGSLYPAIGMHAGCVFFVKLDGLFVDFLNEQTLLFGSKKVYDGMLGWLFIVILGAILYKSLKPVLMEAEA